MSEPNQKPLRFQFSLKTAIIITVLIGGIIGLWFAARHTVKNFMEPEYRLQSMQLSFLIVDQFIKDHPGRWPKSWEELQAGQNISYGIYSWPKDSEEIQKRVTIDFNVRLEDLAQQTGQDFKVAEDFKPIQPKGHITPFTVTLLYIYLRRFERMLNVAARAASRGAARRDPSHKA